MRRQVTLTQLASRANNAIQSRIIWFLNLVCTGQNSTLIMRCYPHFRYLVAKAFTRAGKEQNTMIQPNIIEEATSMAINRFNEAFKRQDIDATMAAMTEDCVFENTYPAPDGARYEGEAAVRAAFLDFFHASPTAEFESEELFAAGNRGFIRWVYFWTSEGNERGHVRGVDIFLVREGKVAEKLSYVKG